jgi:hypothetical protein
MENRDQHTLSAGQDTELPLHRQQRSAGMVYVVDPSPLNWLYVLFNTMEEIVRADHKGRIIASLAAGIQWLDDQTLELRLRQGVVF